jgi:hypothetical protein
MIYHSLGSVFTLTKWIIIFYSQKLNLSFNFQFFSIIYHNIVIWIMKLFRGWAYDNYDDFNMSISFICNAKFLKHGVILNKIHTYIQTCVRSHFVLNLVIIHLDWNFCSFFKLKVWSYFPLKFWFNTMLGICCKK